MNRFLSEIATQGGRRPIAVLLGLGFVTLLLAAFLPSLRVAHDPLGLMPDDPRVDLYRSIEEEFGAGSFTHLITVRFAARQGHRIESPTAIREMEQVLQQLRQVPGVISAVGIPDFVKFVNQELHGGDPQYATLPISEGGNQENSYSFEDVIRMAFQRLALVKKYLSSRGTALVTATVAHDADLIQIARQAELALAPIQQNGVATEIGLASYGANVNIFNKITMEDLRLLTPIILLILVLVLIWVFRLTRLLELGSALALVFLVTAFSLLPNFVSGPTLDFFEVVAALLLLVFVAATFRFLHFLYLPIATVAVAAIWIFGALGLLAIPINSLMIAIVPLLLGVGIDYSIHMLHRYEEERCKGQPGREAMAIALQRTGRALVLTTLSSVVGFTALALTPSPPLQSFGVMAALSMLSAFVVTILLIPASMQLVAEGARTEKWPPPNSLGILSRIMGHPKESALGRLLTGYTRSIHLRAIALMVLLAGVAIGVGGFWIGNSFQTYSINYERMLPADNPLITLQTQINEEFRSFDEVQIFLRGDLARLEVMRILQLDLPAALSSSPYAHKVTSIAQLLDDMLGANAELNEGFLTRFLENPDHAYGWLISEIFQRDSSRARATAYAQLTPDVETLTSVVRVNTIRYADQERIARVTSDLGSRIEPVLTRLREMGIEAQVTGTPFLEELGLRSLRDSFLQSFILAFLLCFVVIAIGMRSLLMSGIVLFPVAVVVGALLGSLVLLRLEINAATAIVVALGIGLGVDFAIHLLNRFLEERDLTRATARTGEALFAAFVTTAAAFFALIFSQITWNRDFGILAGLAITYAFAATILLVPALLRLTQPAREQSPVFATKIRLEPEPIKSNRETEPTTKEVRDEF